MNRAEETGSNGDPREVPRKRFLSKAVPAEGDAGVFTQSWFPVCLSSELPAGKVMGAGFLDGRVVAFRGEDGIAQVMSAYCPHLGADLSVGHVVGDTLRCAFHHWRFNREGACVATGTGDAPPAHARTFRFPTVEKYGLVFAFNGASPLFDIPEFPFDGDDLLFRTEEVGVFQVDPWVICSNVPDLQHLRALHGIRFPNGDPSEEFTWGPYSVLYEMNGQLPNGEPVQGTFGAFGTSIFHMLGKIKGRTFGLLLGYGMPAPGTSKVYLVAAARRSEGTSQADNDAFLGFVRAFEKAIIDEDAAVLQSIHYRPGVLTNSDRALARFFQYLRDYPRAHPSGDFIR